MTIYCFYQFVQIPLRWNSLIDRDDSRREATRSEGQSSSSIPLVYTAAQVIVIAVAYLSFITIHYQLINLQIYIRSRQSRCSCIRPSEAPLPEAFSAHFKRCPFTYLHFLTMFNKSPTAIPI